MVKQVPPDKYYLYYLKDNGDSMVLTRFTPADQTGDGIPRFTWSLHIAVAAWNMPLLFPTLEQAETVIDDQEFNFLGAVTVQIGRWISMDSCRRNLHAPAE